MEGRKRSPVDERARSRASNPAGHVAQSPVAIVSFAARDDVTGTGQTAWARPRTGGRRTLGAIWHSTPAAHHSMPHLHVYPPPAIRTVHHHTIYILCLPATGGTACSLDHAT